jgi:putative heme-binding domain-containing protein
VNAPTWGVDNWIYFGRGHGGGTITGPRLKNPVTLGNTDFRIRADGSAIEPITGSVKTVGMAFTEGGDRFVTTTTSPGLFVTPIEPRYFARNADAAAPLGDKNAAGYDTCFPIAAPHPWRLRREQHGDYFAFYKKISVSDAAASGYFTSVCGPMVYQDSLMPELRGEYFSCEPAQNLVHRARIERQGAALRLKRAPGEEAREFLASSDAWFHPIFLHPTPDGSIAITDFYREIIEDYSAIPRHLQQQYGLLNGRNHGRIWVLTKAGHRPEFQVDLASLDQAKLLQELDSSVQWRRQTARRLLVERNALTSASPFHLPAEPGAALDTLYAFEGCGVLAAEHLLAAWHHPSPEVRRHALRIADQDFSGYGRLVEAELFEGTAGGMDEPQVALQVALSLGNSSSPKRIDALASLARKAGDQTWMDAAIASSAAKHEALLLMALVAEPGNASKVIENLAGVVAARGDAPELSSTMAALETKDPGGRALHLLKLGLEETRPLASPELQVAPKPPGDELVASLEGRLPDFIAALKNPPNLADGRALFTSACSACHRSHGIGCSVGPELDSEHQRAPEVILRDILFPHEAQRPGFETVMARTPRGEIIVGVAASDSPTSVTLRLPGGTERTVLRKRASISTLRNVSVMPFGFGEAFKPAQIADIVGFLRSR